MMEIEVESKNHDLPEEIIREILLKVPVKSLLRFRCVSKQWLSLISSHKFAKAHLKVSTTTNNKFVHDKLIFLVPPLDLYTRPVQSFVEEMGGDNTNTDEQLLGRVRLDCPRGNNNIRISIVGSCNGLVCLCTFSPAFSPAPDSNIFLLNPTTREWKKIPNPGTRPLSSSRYILSFGCDELHDDYKVVEHVYKGLATPTQVNVYSARSNSWKTLSNLPAGAIDRSLPARFLNGSLHWAAMGITERTNKAVVVTLDLGTDTFGQMPRPVDDYAEVCVVGGFLGLYCPHHCGTDVWVMKEYGVSESWTRVVRVAFPMEGQLYTNFYHRPLFFSADGRYILMNCINGESLSCFWIYDTQNPKQLQYNTRSYVEATTYVESLVSLAQLHDEEEEEE